VKSLAVLLVALLCLAAPAACAEASGTLGSEVRDAVGVHTFTVPEGMELRKGDVVAIERGGKRLGEAIVMEVKGARGRVSLRGSFLGAVGDSVVFLRRPSGTPAARGRLDVGGGPSRAGAASRGPAAPIPRWVQGKCSPWYIPAGLSTSGQTPVPSSGGKQDLQVVSTPEQCLAVLHEAAYALDKHFGMRITALPVELEYVPGGMAVIQQAGGQAGRVLYEPDCYLMTIVGDLPREHIYRVALHELAHCWMQETPHRINFKERVVENEGFATWIEVKVLLKEGYHPLVRQVLTDMDGRAAKYSQGFYGMADMEEQYGELGVMNYVYYGNVKGFRGPPARNPASPRAGRGQRN